MKADTTTKASGRRIAPIDITVSDRDRERAFRSARRHTLQVRALKAVLPAIALICLGYYSFTLAFTSALKSADITVGKVTIDPSNLAMADPRYSGFGKDGSEYNVHAESAVTDIRMTGPVKLKVIDGRIKQPNGVVTELKASWGTYEQKKDLLELYERIEVDSTNGMKARLTRATVFAKESRIVSPEPVVAETETGRIQAHAMTLDTKARKAQFVDGVEVTLKPSARPADAKGGEDAAPRRETRALGIDPNSKEPVIVTSRRLDVDDNDKTALFREEVVARQGEASMAAPELDITYTGGRVGEAGQPGDGAGKSAVGDAAKLKTIRARGGVHLTNKADRADSQTLDYDAEAERIVLDGEVVMTQQPDRRVAAHTVALDQRADTALLTGEVVITQGRNVLRGERLSIDRKSGTAKLTSPGEAGRGAGRISTLLYQNQAGKGGRAAAKTGDDNGETGLGPLGTSFKTDPNAPIEIEAVVLDVNDRKHVAVYTGSVVAKQDKFVVKTEEMSAFYQGEMGLLSGAMPGEKPTGNGSGSGQLKRIEARKGVQVNGADGQQATGEWANFDVAANIIVMGGNVVVSQGKQMVRAPAGMRLVIDLGTGFTRFEPEPGVAKGGPKVSGAFSTSVAPGQPGTGSITCPPGAICKSGRLEAIFYPNQLKEKAAGAAASIEAQTKTPAKPKKGPQNGSAWQSTTGAGTPP